MIATTAARIRLIGTLVAFAAVAAGCADSGDAAPTVVEAETESASTNDDDSATFTTATPATSVDDSGTDAAAPEWTQSVAAFDDAAFDDTIPLLTDQFSALDEGTYRSTMLGTEFTFTVVGDWRVQPNEVPLVVLSHPESNGPGDRDLLFMRPGELSDPGDPGNEVGWPLDDIDGWLDNLIPGVLVGEPTATLLGGHDAMVFHVELSGDARCPGGDACVGFAHNKLLAQLWFANDFRYRLYWVAQGEQDPIIVWAGAPTTNTTWFDTVDDVLATVAFGSEQPNPVGDGDLIDQGLPSEVVAGPIELPIGDGVRFELGSDTFIAQAPGKATVFGAGEFGSDFTLVTTDGDGDPLETAAEVADALGADPDLSIVSLPGEQLGGLDALVFDFSLSSAPPSRDAADLRTEGGTWTTSAVGRAWIVDGPDGPFMLTAEAYSTAAADLEQALEFTQSIIDTFAWAG